MNAWFRAAFRGGLEALETLWIWAKGVEINTDELLLSQTRNGHTALQLAAENNHLETLKGTWDWAEETQLNPNELKNKVLLSKDSAGYMAWHHAAGKGRL